MSKSVMRMALSQVDAILDSAKEQIRAALPTIIQSTMAEILGGESVAAPKRRGRPAKTDSLRNEAKVAAASSGGKRRGRPAKAKAEEAVDEKEAPKRRGRPKKIVDAAAVVAAAQPKKRGRPKKEVPQAEVQAAAPKKRGRPPKAKIENGSPSTSEGMSSFEALKAKVLASRGENTAN